MSKSENPLPPEDDPIAVLLQSNIEDMSAEELEAHVEKLHSSTNNPRELGRLLTGAQRKASGKKDKSKKSAAESAAFQALLESL